MTPAVERADMSSATARFDRSATTALLLVGDLAVIALQLSVGLVSHGIDPLAEPAYTAETVAPFLVGWLLVAPLLGIYTARVRESLSETALSVSIAWIVAALVGLGLRATPWLSGGAPAVFVAVTIGVGLAALLSWRLVVTAIVRRA